MSQALRRNVYRVEHPRDPDSTVTVVAVSHPFTWAGWRRMCYIIRLHGSGGAVPVRHTSRLLAGMFMHHIFPDHALVRRDCAVLLAVVGWKQRLAAFELWMADSYSEARLEYTSFDYLPFGPLSEIVFDHYDVILRICFPTEADARRFETLWPTRGPVAGPYAKLWPDNGPTLRKLEPFHSHLIRRLAHAKERRNAKKKNTGGSDPD